MKNIEKLAVDEGSWGAAYGFGYCSKLSCSVAVIVVKKKKKNRKLK